MSPHFLPKLLQEIFKKYEKLNAADRKKSQSQFLLELSALLGEDLLERALRLIDDCLITIYISENKISKFAEFANRRNSAHIVRLPLGVNYCNCAYFTHCVLQQQPEEDLVSFSNSTSLPNDWHSKQSYTCEHVLALRLTEFLDVSILREETLSAQQFQYLYNNIFESE